MHLDFNYTGIQIIFQANENRLGKDFSHCLGDDLRGFLLYWLWYHSHLIWNSRGWASFLGGLVAWGMEAFLGWWLFGRIGLLFCGFLNMVTFDGDVGIVFVEAYNYLSDLGILARFFCRI